MSRNRIASLAIVLPTVVGNQPPPRRKQSILDILVTPLPVTPIPLSESSLENHDGDDGDYRDIPSTPERLIRAHGLFQRDVLDPFENSANTSVVATPENLKEELKTFLTVKKKSYDD